MSKRERVFEIGIVSANDFRFVSTSSAFVQEDQETERLSIKFREGIGRGLEWSVEAPYLSRGGGFQDPIIDWWHANVLHWSDSMRDHTPFGRSQVTVPSAGTFGSASGVGDVSLYLAKDLGRGLSLTAGLKLPTGDADKLLGSGQFDAGLYAQKRWSLGRKLALYAQVGGVAQGTARKVNGTRSLIHQEGLSLVWQRNSRDAWIIQWQGEASALETSVPASDATHRLVTFGYKRKLNSRQVLDLYFSEDKDLFNDAFPEGASVGPDFTMGARINIRF